MIKFIVAGLMLTVNAFAGLPPTTLKGQGGSNITTFGFQVPLNQATQVSGVNSLIETGNANGLANPGFEGTTGWTASGGATAAINTTAVGTGVNGYNWDSDGAAQTLRGTAITIPNSWKGNPGITFCSVKTPSGTATHTIGVYDGSSLLSSTTILSNTTFVPAVHQFNFPTSGTITVQLTSVASNEPEIYIDDCWIGLLSKSPAGGVTAAITAPVAYTPTISGFGTITNNSAYYWQVGSSIEVQGSFTAGATAGSLASISVPSACTIDSSKLSINNTTSSNGPIIGRYSQDGAGTATNYGSLVTATATSTSLVYFGSLTVNTAKQTPQNGSAVANSSLPIAYTFSVPCANLASVVNTATTPIITAYTAYTPTFTGFGTVTVQDFKYRQVGGSVEIEGRWTPGTTTATEARISLPSFCTSASDYATLENVGFGVIEINGRSLSILIEPSVTYVTFGGVESSINGLTKRNGNDLGASGNKASIKASIRCTGMPGVIPAPNLVGFATNNGSSAIRVEGANIAAPSAGACVVTETGSSDWISGNATSGATGACTVTFNAGIWSSAPICVCISTSSGAAFCGAGAPATTSTFTTSTVTHAGADSNQDRQMICMGAR